MAGLVEKGAAHLMEGAATKYTPVPLEEFCGGRIRDLEEYRDKLLKLQPVRRETSDGYITVPGKKQILRKMRAMTAGARERIYASMSAELLRLILPELENAVGRSLKVVLITEPSFSLDGALIYGTEKRQDQIRLIVDSNCVLTGDFNGAGRPACTPKKKIWWNCSRKP